MPVRWKAPALCFYALFCLAWASGCGDTNSGVVYVPEGRDAGHLAGWMPGGHAERALRDIGSCTECHGDALDGGISAVGCSACHLGGVNSAHPPDWTDISYHGPYAVSNGYSSCASVYCHGANLEGVAGSGPSCATACHMGGVFSKHPLSWSGDAFSNHRNYAEQYGTAACANQACHGALLQGVPESGPSCSSCHDFPP